MSLYTPLWNGWYIFDSVANRHAFSASPCTCHNVTYRSAEHTALTRKPILHRDFDRIALTNLVSLTLLVFRRIVGRPAYIFTFIHQKAGSNDRKTKKTNARKRIKHESTGAWCEEYTTKCYKLARYLQRNVRDASWLALWKLFISSLLCHQSVYIIRSRLIGGDALRLGR